MRFILLLFFQYLLDLIEHLPMQLLKWSITHIRWPRVRFPEDNGR